MLINLISYEPWNCIFFFKLLKYIPSPWQFNYLAHILFVCALVFPWNCTCLWLYWLAKANFYSLSWPTVTFLCIEPCYFITGQHTSLLKIWQNTNGLRMTQGSIICYKNKWASTWESRHSNENIQVWVTSFCQQGKFLNLMVFMLSVK